ncbi:MAG: sulfotransferase family protein [Pseudomonadota bacterium]|uniref:sulfotransferase family protein n=1 Tax=Roseovarius TaxID=74030 RepID=UPI0022A6D9F1|nr:sulfotransferase family protein [Roseovarius sp. EGI FJ00037]MCZ0811369.1 sulfotransferase family protein [Roseovarius sp. EGI FJ00037]
MIGGLTRRWWRRPASGHNPRHVILLPRHGIAYVRVPKAANSSVKAALALAFELRSKADAPVSQDRFWNHVAQGEALRLTPGRFVSGGYATRCWTFTFVRHPVARLYSCWNNKVIENTALSPAFERMGVRTGMSFADFVRAVGDTPDDRADIHVCSQAAILEFRGKPVADFVGRLESIQADWARINQEIETRTGIAPGRMRRKNVRGMTMPDVAESLPDDVLARIRRRYARDFALFYPQDGV